MIDGYACATERGRKYHMDRNEPCRICKEWWEKVQAGTAATAAPVRSLAQVVQCGTAPGYRKHRRNAEAACKPCREAAALERQKFDDKRRTEREGASGRGRAAVPREHGTAKGRGQHKRRGETPCEPCQTAYNKMQNENRNLRLYGTTTPPAQKIKPSPCGSVRGYKHHVKEGTPRYAPCKAAKAAETAKWRAETDAKVAA